MIRIVLPELKALTISHRINSALAYAHSGLNCSVFYTQGVALGYCSTPYDQKQ